MRKNRVKQLTQFTQTKITNFQRDNFGMPLAHKISQIWKWISHRFTAFLSTDQRIVSLRNRISEQLFKQFEGTVRYGLFSGLKLPQRTYWGRSEISSQLLGIYEIEIQNSIFENSIGKRYFVDIGAADGYFAIGVLVANLFESSIAYEIDPRGREIIKTNAALNGVSNKIQVRGEANSSWYDEYSKEFLADCLILIDIEGFEFSLMNETSFMNLSSSIIIIEIHDFLVEDGEKRLQQLLQESATTHSHNLITSGSRNLNVFPELANYSDDYRWLIASEGRSQVMKWLIFSPL